MISNTVKRNQAAAIARPTHEEWYDTVWDAHYAAMGALPTMPIDGDVLFMTGYLCESRADRHCIREAALAGYLGFT